MCKILTGKGPATQSTVVSHQQNGLKHAQQHSTDIRQFWEHLG